MRSFILMLSLSVATVVSASPSLFDTLQARFNDARLPDSRHVHAGEIWAGKCVPQNSPHSIVGGAVFFQVTEDPVLGKIFKVIPAFRYYYKSELFRPSYIWLQYTGEKTYLSLDASSVFADFARMLADPNTDYSTVSIAGGSWLTTTTVHYRNDWSSGVTAVFASYLRETASTDGKPLFLLRHDLVREKSEWELSSLAGPTEYCYFGENKGVGKPKPLPLPTYGSPPPAPPTP
jgi:hypothetical protein